MTADGASSLVRQRVVESPRPVSTNSAPADPGDRLLAEVQRQCLRTRRLEAVGRVALGVARDVAQLASSVVGCAAGLAQHEGVDERISQGLSQIRMASERSAALARQLITLGDVESGGPEVVELNEAIESVTRFAHGLLGADIELALLLGRGRLEALVDPGKLDELIVAQLASALRSASGRGRLRIETSKVEISGVQPANVDPPKGAYVVISVSAEPSGAGESDIREVLGPIENEARRMAGRELLAVCELAAECGGYAAVEGGVGGGGAVKVWLPESPPPKSQGVTVLAPAASGRAPAVVPGGFETILLVENDRHARMSARHILKSRGYRVVEVASSRSALATSARHPKRFAALIVNVVLPELNGYMLAERLRAERPDLKLLFLSSYPGSSAYDGAITLRGAAFLRKPFTAASLSTTLRRLLDEPDDAP